ncbi:M24 family metallopeptidase [Candidatus Latescibacterota bacterium]
MKKKAFEVIRKKMRDLSLDSFLIAKQSNIRYLTGFTGDYGYIAVTSDNIFFFTSQLYEEQARSIENNDITFVTVKEYFIDSFSEINKSIWGKKIGFESEVITCSVFSKLNEKMDFADFKPSRGIIEKLREIKDLSEIQSISNSQKITDSVFEYILGIIDDGIEERDLACEIDYQLLKKGGERLAFETIVASGPNTSKPHAITSKRKLKKGDLVLFDFGTFVDGYASDMTRTIVLGKADKEQKRLYNLVFNAQLAAIDSISSGMKSSELFKTVMDIFRKAGYSEKFIHSLGHGVGIEVHESPRLSANSDDILKINSVITIEPGIYIPGWGGIRIEDMVIVTENGCENLTHSQKTLIEL